MLAEGCRERRACASALTAPNEGSAADAGTDTGLSRGVGAGRLRSGTPTDVPASLALVIAERNVPAPKAIWGSRSSGTKRTSSSQRGRLDLTTTSSGASRALVHSVMMSRADKPSGPTRNTMRAEGMNRHMSSITPTDKTGSHLLLLRSDITASSRRTDRSICMISSSRFARSEFDSL